MMDTHFLLGTSRRASQHLTKTNLAELVLDTTNPCEAKHQLGSFDSMVFDHEVISLCQDIWSVQFPAFFAAKRLNYGGLSTVDCDN